MWSESGQITAVAAPPGQDGTSTGDLALPLIALGTAVLLAVYGHARRQRRPQDPYQTRRRGRPSGPDAVLRARPARARRSLVEADDAVRTSAEELRAGAGAQFGDAAVGAVAEALAARGSELAAAFRMRHRLDETVPGAGQRTRRQLCGDPRPVPGGAAAAGHGGARLRPDSAPWKGHSRRPGAGGVPLPRADRP